MKYHDFTERKLPLLTKPKRRLLRLTLYRGLLVIDNHGKTWSLATTRDLLATGLAVTEDPNLVEKLAAQETPT